MSTEERESAASARVVVTGGEHASYQASEHGSERVSTYRDRLAEAIKSVRIHPKLDSTVTAMIMAGVGFHITDEEAGPVADAVVAVPNPELDWLSAENTRLAAELATVHGYAPDLDEAEDLRGRIDCEVAERIGGPCEAITDALMVFATREVARAAGDEMTARWRTEAQLAEARAELRYDHQIEAELTEAKKKIEDLSSSLDRVRHFARHQRRTSQGRVENYVNADDVLAIADDPLALFYDPEPPTKVNPLPGDTPEPNRSGS